MRIFELPKMEIKRFEIENILTVSGGQDSTDGNLVNGSGNAAGSNVISDTVSTFSIGYDAIDMGA